MMKVDDVVSRVLSQDTDGKVQFIVLYGSRANGDFRKDSDMDICIGVEGTEEERGEFRLKVLSSLMDDDIDIHIYQDLPLYIKKDIFKGELLYTKDLTMIYDLAYEDRKAYEDFEHRYLDYIGMREME
jgi:hypothetical protein